MADSAALARQVLAADGQPLATLSLAPSLGSVSFDTPVADARRHYMRLAALIHPDRLKGTFDKATEAFQCLVRAFETFADPRARKLAQAAAAKEATKAEKLSKQTQRTASSAARAQRTRLETDKKGEAPRKKKHPRARAASEDETEEDSEGSEEDQEEEEETASDTSADDIFAEAQEPVVSNSRTPIGKPRVGGMYAETTVGCPHCRTRWEPDSKPQYSLFMGPWGLRVHCQLCLFVFGSATALHACPHCTAPFDYDASQYESTATCQRCKKTFGFAYYPVNQRLIDQVALDEWRERRERERAKEREERHRARYGEQDAGDRAEEQLQLLVGSCIMEDQCPLCHQRVKSKHRQHVEECMKRSSEDQASGRKQSNLTPTPNSKERKVPAKSASTARRATAAALSSKPKAKKAAPKRSNAAPVKKAAAATTKRRRPRSSSDEDETDESEESEQSASDSEDSFTDEDDDSSDDE